MPPTTRRIFTALVCVQAFAAFGKSYAEGQPVPEEDLADWPEGTLERRLENKWVAWKPVSQTDVAEADPSATPFTHPELLESQTKAEIAGWAVEVYGPELAGSLDPNKLTKADLLLAVQTLISEYGDPEAAE